MSGAEASWSQTATRLNCRGKKSLSREELRLAEQRGAELAQSVVRAYRTNDVFEIARIAGVEIVYRRWALVTIGECDVCARRITINCCALEAGIHKGYQASCLERIIIAHELGHWFDATLTAAANHPSGGGRASEYAEQVAHSFAVNLLGIEFDQRNDKGWWLKK